jgi:hypothetical protein
MNKSIHFYKDDNMNLSKFHISHNATIKAIENKKVLIHTYAISALDFAYLLDSGYDIFLHENNKHFQIKVGTVEATDKEINKGNDIRKLWLGGGFDGYFYGE